MYKIIKKVIYNTIPICLLVVLNAGTIGVEDDIIYWTRDKRLAFTDFKGRPAKDDIITHDVSSTRPAHKLGGIIKSIDVQVKTQNGKTAFKIYAGMKMNLSWIKYDNDTITLRHEQGHFDICEIYARILRREIRNAKSLSDAKTIFSKISDEEELEQDKYDKENTFQLGGITPYWNDIILKRLKALELYQEPVVTLPLAK